MKIEKVFIISMILILILSISLIIFAKCNIKKINYEKFLNDAFYSVSIKEEYLSLAGYEKIENIISDEIDYSIDDIKSDSEAILIVTMNTNPIFYGKGIINNCKIKKVIKGETFNVNDDIKIYDLIEYWRGFSGHYLGGSTPLKIGEDYLVFIKKSPRPNLKDTYIYSSVPYGHILVSDDIKILENYENSTLKLIDIINYQYVFLKDTNEKTINIYKDNCNKILEYFKLK